MAEVRQRWRKAIGNTGLMKKKQSSDPAVLCPASANGLSLLCVRLHISDNACCCREYSKKLFHDKMM